MKYRLLPALLILLGITLLFLIIDTVAGGMIVMRGFTTAHLRSFAVLQDLLVFILPAIITALIVSTTPARLLAIDRSPSTAPILMALLAMVVAVPAMNFVIEWNESLSLPSAFSSIEAWMRSSEDAAQQSVEILMGGTSVSDLILGILIIGLFAALAEELYFRGTIMRMMLCSGINPHVAIWVTAFIFSAIHVQFFGFFPRLLLGAFFGYLTFWRSSVWLSVITHAFNNSIVVITSWLERRGTIGHEIDTLGSENYILILASVILTAGVIRAMKKHLFPTPK
ncbi:MAG: CPBP family intramembrane metalloprotease [Lachnoclostridium sp.]|nr:CPBP family intramembrane metalloprotease [Lachnoclostridium sp.]